MGAAPGPGWEEGEFEFKLVFEEDPPPRQNRGPEPVRTVEQESPGAGEETEGVLQQLDSCTGGGDGNGSCSLGQGRFFLEC